MNPRHRRLLIPGLLIILMVIVVVSSLSRRADAADATSQPVSRIADPRITESSGLVLSRAVDDLAYTVNDSGNAPIVFAVRVSTGAVVGATTLDADLVDSEALSIDGSGTIWIADTGDNEGVREDVALYSLPEPGEGDATVRPTRYPLTYPDGPRDVESLAIDRGSDRKILLTKGLFGGEVYAVPDTLEAGEDNEVTAVDASVPGVLTDAAFSTDGAFVVARDYRAAHVLDARTWQEVDTVTLPDVEQGETLAMEPGGRTYLVGSEGKDSPLLRVGFDEPAPSPDATAATERPGPATTTPPENGNGFAGATWFWSALVMALLAAICVAANGKS